MSPNKEIQDFLDAWTTDEIEAKKAFMEYGKLLSTTPDVDISFRARPGISYSMRAKNRAQKKRDLFVLVDVVDDDPDNRWLSVCFYGDMVTDPDGLGDTVPDGLEGEDAICFNLDENNPETREYIAKRIKEAAKKAAE